MKKSFLIALVTVLCAGGAMAQDSKAKRIPEPVEHSTKTNQTSKNPGTAKQKGATDGNAATKGKDIHNDEKDALNKNNSNDKNKKYVRPNDQPNPKNTETKHHAVTNSQQTQGTAHPKSPK